MIEVLNKEVNKFLLSSIEIDTVKNPTNYKLLYHFSENYQSICIHLFSQQFDQGLHTAMHHRHNIQRIYFVTLLKTY